MEVKNLERCEACKHVSFSRPANSIQSQLICRRLPPVPVVVMTPNGPGMSSVQPVVTPDTYCAEFFPAVVSG